MANYVYVATSLDGFIATPGGGVEWLEEIPNPEKSDFGYSDFIAGINAIVMGRNTFEKVLTFDFWPYEKPLFVLSNTLKAMPEVVDGKAEIIQGSPGVLVGKLNEMGYLNLYIDGGGVIQSFLEEDLIDEMFIARVPVLLGNGIPLFRKLSKRLQFTHKKTKVLGPELVMSHYTRVR